MSNQVFLSPEYLSQVKQNIDSPLFTENQLNEAIEIYKDLSHYENCLNELETNATTLVGKKVLEVGSGYGLMIALACNKYKYDFYGLEPSKNKYEGRYEISQVLMTDNKIEDSRICCGIGEMMPYPDESFDIVYSFQVLEHVNDPFLVLKESWRVLKKGGTLYINAPNYNFFFEGHYHVFWIPGMPKWMAKIYLKLLGKDSNYIEHINFLTQRKINSYLKEITGREIISDFGLNNWADRMNNTKLSNQLNPTAKRIFTIAKSLKLISLIVFLGRIFKWQDTLRVAVTK